MRALRSLAIALLLVLMAAVAIWFELRSDRRIAAADGRQVTVIDGDSLREEIRLAGIDAPEYRQACLDEAGRSWPCGREARAALVRLAAAGGLECPTRAEDRFGRALATCRTDAGDVARAMVAAGYAEGAGDERFDGHPARVAEARRAKRGIWRGPHQHPADWRRANPR